MVQVQNSTRVSPSQRFTRRNPCPICGGGDNDPRGRGIRCAGFLSEDGQWGHCTNSDYAGALTANEKSNPATYAHKLYGTCRCGQEHNPAPAGSNGHKRPIPLRATAYPICDASGALVATHMRQDYPGRDGKPDKRVWWERNGQKGLGDLRSEDLPLYNLRALAHASPGVRVYLCEGEKATDALTGAGLLAVGTVTGASGTPSRAVLEALRGHEVILWPDNDGPNAQKPAESSSGQKHMLRIASTLQALDIAYRWLSWPGAPAKGDAYDYIAGTGDVALLDALVTDTPPALPETPTTADERLPIADMADLLSEQLPPLRWIVDGVLPDGCSLLAGKPKMGKSWLALGLAISVATGGIALGRDRVQQGAVLYLALEDNKRRLQARAKQVLAGSSLSRGYFTYALAWRRLDDGGADMLERWIKDTPTARLIIVDTLAKVRPRACAGANAYAEDYTATEPLKALSDKYGIAILIVHHLRKMGADDPLDTISGTLGLTGGVDNLLVLQRERGDLDAVLHVSGRETEDNSLALSFDKAMGTWSIKGDAEAYQRSKERTEIIELLQGNEPMRPKAIADTLGKRYDAVRYLLSQMAREGQVQTLERGLYTIDPSHPSQASQASQASHPSQVLDSEPGTQYEGCEACEDVRLVRADRTWNGQIQALDKGQYVPLPTVPLPTNETNHANHANHCQREPDIEPVSVVSDGLEPTNHAIPPVRPDVARPDGELVSVVSGDHALAWNGHIAYCRKSQDEHGQHWYIQDFRTGDYHCRACGEEVLG